MIRRHALPLIASLAIAVAGLVFAPAGMAATLFEANFDNPGGIGLGPDASSMVFAGQTNASPTPTNPDGFLVLGGSGTGGMIFVAPAAVDFSGPDPLVVSSEASYVSGTNDGSNSFMGLVALHLQGTSNSGNTRRGGLFAQLRTESDGSGLMRLGYQTDSTVGGDAFEAPISSAITAGAIPDPDGVFEMSLSIAGLDDSDALTFTVTQGLFSQSINSTILGYRNSLSAAPQAAFDLVRSELQADPTLMNFGFESTSSIVEQYDFLRITGFVAPPIPEPSTIMLLGLGVVGLVRRTRRRRHIAA